MKNYDGDQWEELGGDIGLLPVKVFEQIKLTEV